MKYERKETKRLRKKRIIRNNAKEAKPSVLSNYLKQNIFPLPKAYIDLTNNLIK